jgi:hypothetical protein
MQGYNPSSAKIDKAALPSCIAVVGSGHCASADGGGVQDYSVPHSLGTRGDDQCNNLKYVRVLRVAVRQARSRHSMARGRVCHKMDILAGLRMRQAAFG